jgi:hypothetical protein
MNQSLLVCEVSREPAARIAIGCATMPLQRDGLQRVVSGDGFTARPLERIGL